jgi:hypothetical protein
MRASDADAWRAHLPAITVVITLIDWPAVTAMHMRIQIAQVIIIINRDSHVDIFLLLV